MDLVVQLSEYGQAARKLVDHQHQFLEEFAANLEAETAPPREWTIYGQLVAAIANFHRIARENLDYVLKHGDPTKVRVCMLLNQYVLDDDKAKAGVQMARSELQKNSGKPSDSAISRATIHAFAQLRADLVVLKAAQIGANDFEQFATSMAVIKVNRLLNADPDCLQPNDHRHYLETVLDSPNDTSLASTKLVPRGPTALGSSSVSGGSSVSKAPETPDISRLRLQLAPVVALVALCKHNLWHCSHSACQLSQQWGHMATSWWKMLGNNYFDYGVERYVEMCFLQQHAITTFAARLEAAATRWATIEAELLAVVALPRRTISGAALAAVVGGDWARAKSHWGLARKSHPSPLPGPAATEQLRILLLELASVEMNGVAAAAAAMFAAMITGPRANPGVGVFARHSSSHDRQPQISATYLRIVEEYQACVEFTARAMAHTIEVHSIGRT